MAKNETVINEVEKTEVVNQEVEISYPLKREGYLDRKTDKTLYSYHVLERAILNGRECNCKVKITCNKKDVDVFELISTMFDLGLVPTLTREPYSMTTEDGNELSGFFYYVNGEINGKIVKVQVAPMKSSDKAIADILFDKETVIVK